MNKRNSFETDQKKITVGLNELQTMLGLGRESTERVANAAGAVIWIGRRKLYHVGKVEAYMESLAELGE